MRTIITQMPFDETVRLLKEKHNELSEDGTFFAAVSTEYDEQGNVRHDFLEIIEKAAEQGYHYVNTIVYPTASGQEAAFFDNAKYIVWLCINHSEMKINKDAIREKHIWKDVEWGKREKNYNPKGKDPGNVWIPTSDDGKANITDHILLDDEAVIKRLLLFADCKDDFEIFLPEAAAAPEVSAAETASESTVKYSGECSGTVYFKSSEDMREIKDSSVKVVVTSPPYWNLKDYFKKGQIGQEPYAEYLMRMEKVWRQCYDKLTDSGSLWININIRVSGGKVIGIPRDFVKICRKIGFYYKGIFIWHKSSGIPTNEKNIVDRHEYVLLFSKRPDFAVDRSVQRSYRDYKNDNINCGVFWNINRKAGSVGKKYIHPAIYPNELAARIIRMVTDEGDTVLDPFLGSGTTLIAALKNRRSFIGYEYNEGFRELMLSRFGAELPDGSVINI